MVKHFPWNAVFQSCSKHYSLMSRWCMMQHSSLQSYAAFHAVCPCALGLMLMSLGLMLMWSARRAFYAMHTADQWLALALDTIGALLSFLVSMLVVGLKGQLGASKSALVLERVRPRHCGLHEHRCLAHS